MKIISPASKAMKNLTITLTASLLGITGSLWSPSEAVTINSCIPDVVPNGTCLSDATSYRFAIYSIRLCRDNPFPTGTAAPDFTRAGCGTVFESSTPFEGNLSDGTALIFPSENRNISDGTYQYITIVARNFASYSGSFRAGATTWRTKGSITGDSNVVTTAGSPIEQTDTGTSWTGGDGNGGNPYCTNGGGTPSRCELSYNGNISSGVFTNSALSATSGAGVTRIVFTQNLSSPVTVQAGRENTIRVLAKTEVTGNGIAVTTIFGAPFTFNVR